MIKPAITKNRYLAFFFPSIENLGYLINLYISDEQRRKLNLPPGLKGALKYVVDDLELWKEGKSNITANVSSELRTEIIAEIINSYISQDEPNKQLDIDEYYKEIKKAYEEVIDKADKEIGKGAFYFLKPVIDMLDKNLEQVSGNKVKFSINYASKLFKRPDGKEIVCIVAIICFNEVSEDCRFRITFRKPIDIEFYYALLTYSEYFEMTSTIWDIKLENMRKEFISEGEEGKKYPWMEIPLIVEGEKYLWMEIPLIVLERDVLDKIVEKLDKGELINKLFLSETQKIDFFWDILFDYMEIVENFKSFLPEAQKSGLWKYNEIINSFMNLYSSENLKNTFTIEEWFEILSAKIHIISNEIYFCFYTPIHFLNPLGIREILHYIDSSV